MIEKVRNTIKQWFATKKKAIEKWAHKRGLTATIWAFVIIVAMIFLSIAAAVVVAFFTGWDYFLKISFAELLRLLIYGIGGIGAAVGLRIAIQRQEKFSKQVDVQTEQMRVQADQSFNDRLGRGVELLADEKNVVMRCAGIRVLIDLFNNANEEQKTIIASIVYDFFHEKTRTKYDGSKKEVHQDVQNALNFLLGLSRVERQKLFPSKLFEGRLDFRYLDLSNLDFTKKTLECIDFSGTTIQDADFSHATIQDTDFSHATIQNVNFSCSTIENSEFGMGYDSYLYSKIISSFPPKSIMRACNFLSAKIKDTIFCNMTIESTHFSHTELAEGANFHDVEFWRGTFYCEDIISVSSDSDLPHFIGTNLGNTDFQFTNVLKPDKFLKLCYASMDKDQGGITIFIDESRAYKFVNFMGFFIESNKPWSGQPVEAWVEVEIAELKLERAKQSGEDTAQLEIELDEAKTALHKAQERLRKLLKEHENKPKPKKP